MRTDRPRRLRAAALTAASVVLTLTAGGAVAVAGPARAHGADQPRVPVVSTDSGLVRGETAGTGFAFRGVPYAAPDRRAALAGAPAAGLVARSSGRDQLRAELPAEVEPVPAAPSPVGRLSLPERVDPDPAPACPTPGRRLDPRRRQHPGRSAQLRRHRPRGRGGGGHRRLPAGHLGP